MELRIHSALHDAELRGILPRASSLCRSTPVRSWGERSRRRNTPQQQVAAVQTRYLGCGLRRRSARLLAVFPLPQPPLHLFGAVSNSTDQPPNPITCI